MAIKLRINPPAASELKRLRQLGAERRQFLDELEAAPVSRETLAAAGTTAVSAAAAARAAALTAARAAQEAEQALLALDRKLHPDRLELEVKRLWPQGEGGACSYELGTADGGPLPPFGPGQYLSLQLPIEGRLLSRPYSLCGSPDLARQGLYSITVRPGGYAADYILENWQIGQAIAASPPQGEPCYEPLRDGERLLALISGSGATALLPLARQVAEGRLQCRLTLVYVEKQSRDLLFQRELDGLAALCPRIEVIYLIEEQQPAALPLTLPQLRQWLGQEDCSVFLSCPRALRLQAAALLEELGLPRKFIRVLPGRAARQPFLLKDYPREAEDGIFRLTVRDAGGREAGQGEARAWETVLSALERAGAAPLGLCHSHECGFCRSRLLSGQVYYPPEEREKEKNTAAGLIHPCCCYPLSDICVELLCSGPKGPGK